MPVLDWARTEWDHKWEDGSTSLFFNKLKFVYFDCYILKREGAEKDYNREELEAAALMDKNITEEEKTEYRKLYTKAEAQPTRWRNNLKYNNQFAYKKAIDEYKMFL